MYFIGSEPCRGVDGVVVGVLNVREVSVPVILVFVPYHGQHLRHGVIYAFGRRSSLACVHRGACRRLLRAVRRIEGRCRIEALMGIPREG